MARQDVPKENRPNVAIIYSDGSKASNESKYLAQYLCGQLASTGYTNMHMISLSPDGMPQQLGNERISYHGVNSSSKRIEIPVSDVTYGHFDVLATCHVIIVCVNSEDTKSCRTKLATVLDQKRQQKDMNITIFSLQRGVKNGDAIKSSFTQRKDIAVVGGMVGFACVPNPKTKSIMPTVNGPCITLERIDKEIENIVIGPCNLIESMLDVEVYYRKVLSSYTWGVLVWENIHCVNMLTGGSIYSTLENKEARLIIASMISESVLSLKRAARGGKWKPDFLVYSQYLSASTLEKILCLPTSLCMTLLWCFGVLPHKDIQSPMLIDYLEGRVTCNKTQLGEIVDTGKRYSTPTPVCCAVNQLINEMDTKIGEPKSLLDIENKKYIIQVLKLTLEYIDKEKDEIKNVSYKNYYLGKESQAKLSKTLSRYGIILLMIIIFYVLFVHEHEHEEELEALPGHLDQEIM
jgi:ketopantoate reductase